MRPFETNKNPDSIEKKALENLREKQQGHFVDNLVDLTNQALWTKAGNRMKETPRRRRDDYFKEGGK